MFILRVLCCAVCANYYFRRSSHWIRFLFLGDKILSILTTGASNETDTINERMYESTTCPKNAITTVSFPKWNGESRFIAVSRITIGCTKYAQ